MVKHRKKIVLSSSGSSIILEDDDDGGWCKIAFTDDPDEPDASCWIKPEFRREIAKFIAGIHDDDSPL